MEEKILNKSCCRNNFSKNTQINNLCPVCGKEGVIVKNFTIRHILIEDLLEQIGDEDYYLCMNEDCEVAYYNNKKGIRFNKHQLRVPLWFKKNANPKYACYCSKVTEDEIIKAVVDYGATTMEEVINLTGAMSNSDCQKKNPLGKCCHKIVQDAIDKGLNIRSRLA
ncbi:Csac_0668 family 2Fe-2S cluster-binding (seleno)protein [Thermoanaerobacter sp. YS13]|uniref:Csac_0668 family 2Fe-2S cluster-binding (seleno)protein n=1 Tax=Thermoanaerobacter sp. YS13 TaxID=1511746 RepID=UPI0009F5DD9A|nr:(2Fe-2S)-binding protein [Thermoanaerobacter sp. YS13]